MLLDRQTFSHALSALPFLQQLTSHTGPLSGRLELSREEVLGIMDITAHVLRILCLLLHLQKRLGFSLQLLGSQLQAVLEYDPSVVSVFVSEPPPETSPLLDTLNLIDRDFTEPEAMPPYLNVIDSVSLLCRTVPLGVGSSVN